MGDKAGEGTAALEKAIDVLEAIGDSPQGLGHVELAARLGLPRTTVYRILATLVARGMVWRDPLRRVYCLGSRTIELARKAYSMPDLVAAAAAELRAHFFSRGACCGFGRNLRQTTQLAMQVSRVRTRFGL